MKNYSCSVCKKTVKGAIALTRHIRDCKSGKIARRGQKPACKECGKHMSTWSALGAHRFRSHGVHGQSPWSVRLRAMKKAEVHGLKKPVAAEVHDNDAASGILNQAAACRGEAMKLIEKADKLEDLAKKVQGILA